MEAVTKNEPCQTTEMREKSVLHGHRWQKIWLDVIEELMSQTQKIPV